jgi:hypothetical protein
MNIEETDWRAIAEDLESELRGLLMSDYETRTTPRPDLKSPAIQSFNAAAEKEGRRCDVPAFSKSAATKCVCGFCDGTDCA